MKRIEGCADVEKVATGSGMVQDITVTDAGTMVEIALTTSSYPARLTVAEARHIAKALNAAAARAVKKSVPKT